MLQLIGLLMAFGFVQVGLCSEQKGIKAVSTQAVQYEKMQRLKLSSPLYRSFQKYFSPVWKKERNDLAVEMKEKSNFKISGDLPLYLVSANCDGQEIVLLDHSELKITDSMDPSPHIDGDNAGSGGMPVEIYARPRGDGSQFTLLGSQRVITLLGLSAHAGLGAQGAGCPGIAVEVHGGEFDRVGNDYGIAELVYGVKDKKYVLFVPKYLKVQR